MAAGFFIKQGDRQPALAATLQQPVGSVINLASCVVAFHMVGRSGQGTVTGAAVIASAAGGYVRYPWGATDTAIAGDFAAEFEVTFADGTTLTVPNDSDFSVIIRPELG